MMLWKTLLVVSLLTQGSAKAMFNASKTEIETDRNQSLPYQNLLSNTSSTLASKYSCEIFPSSCDSGTTSDSKISSETEASNANSGGLDETSILTQQYDVFSSVPSNINTPLVSDGTNQTFLSFNEWRMAKLNQEVLKEEKRPKLQEPIAVDTQESEAMGDDMEIELSFFSSTGNQANQETEPEGKVYNHKFNFASLDCAATIVKTNSEASGATSILTENKDKYLLNPCSAPNKFIIIELCQDILVEEVAIANFEFFSSTFNRVRFSVSDLYPVAKNGWRMIGEFEAEDSRTLQTFPIQNPQIWARYLRVEVLSHHDNEFYCPVSLIRVHGKTMMDEFKMENTQEASQQQESEQLKESIDESSEQCINEIIEKCNSWPSIDPDNITYLPDLPNTFSSCQSKLVPLKFEEFLKDLNRTYCLPKSKTNNASFSPSPSFSTEESIFKNIVKRLATLEGNATLTVLYIEEQSKLLAESFEQMERTQSFKFDNLVSIFNKTIMENLNVLRIFANQLKDQSIRILEEQKLNNDLFTTQNTIKLANLEKELKTQQRMASAIASSLIAATIYFLFHRTSYLKHPNEVPISKEVANHVASEESKQ